MKIENSTNLGFLIDKKIIAIDPGSNLGWCFYNGKTGLIEAGGVERVSMFKAKKRAYKREMVWDMTERVNQIINEFDPFMVIFEDLEFVVQKKIKTKQQNWKEITVLLTRPFRVQNVISGDLKKNLYLTQKNWVSINNVKIKSWLQIYRKIGSRYVLIFPGTNLKEYLQAQAQKKASQYAYFYEPKPKNHDLGDALLLMCWFLEKIKENQKPEALGLHLNKI